MARLLSSKKSTYGSPYAYYTLDVSVASRTPTAVKLSVTVTARLQYSQSWLGTGRGYGLVAGVYVGGAWHTFTIKSESVTWRGTANHSVSTTITVSAAAATASLTGVYFRVLRTTGGGTSARLDQVKVGNIGIGSVTATYSNVKLAAGSIDQTKATLTLSGIPKSVGYARTIRWYNGSTQIGTTPISASSAATSFTCALSGLLPNTDYTAKAVVYSGSTALCAKTVVVSTPQETGTLSLSAAATYLTVSVGDMFNLPNYTRTIEFYIKKSVDADYALFTTKTAQGTSISASLTGLISNVKYDVMIRIKNGSTILKTLSATMATTKDTSLVPTARIENITQRLGTRNCTVTWIVDKEIAGTTYTMQAKKAGDSDWTTLATLTSFASPYVVTAKAGNIDTTFRISSENAAVAASVTNHSNEYALYVRDNFVWDSPKTAGQPMVITANEWNRLCEYVISRNREAGNVVDIPMVKQGDAITAGIYNTMKNAINQVSAVGVSNKTRGDVITAADIDALRVAINNVA